MYTTRFARPLLAGLMILFTLALALFGTPASVDASYGGENGRLFFGIKLNDNMDIYSVLPNGFGLRRLTTDPAFDACAASSRDGRQITFCSNRSGAFEIWTMKANGTQQHQVTHAGGSLTFPDFSPDGRRLVFGGSLAGETESDIFVSKADGSGLVRLTTAVGDDMYPAWSPNGRHIVFISTRTGIGKVWVMNADGSNQRQLTFDAAAKDQVPDWKPDGTKIAYSCGNSICVMNADGSGQTQRTMPLAPAYDFGPAWSPDGTQIAFVRFLNDSEQNVYIMHANGSDQHVVHPLGLQAVPTWQPRGEDQLH